MRVHSTVTMNERASRVSRPYQLLYFSFLSFGIIVLLFAEFNIFFSSSLCLFYTFQVIQSGQNLYKSDKDRIHVKNGARCFSPEYSAVWRARMSH